MTKISGEHVVANKKNSIKKELPLTIMALPAILLLFLFNYVPMFGLVLAFKDFKYNLGLFGSPWIGIKNFLFFFNSQDAWRVTRNTIGYNLVFIISTLAISVTLAIILFEIVKMSAIKFYQTAMFVPYLLSMSVVAYVSYAFLSTDYGVLNSILETFGKDPGFWYQDPILWILILPIVYLWKNAGYYIIIYYAGLMGIDRTYYEAAQIDGANRIKMILKLSHS